jgi:predicted acetyltransferase
MVRSVKAPLDEDLVLCPPDMAHAAHLVELGAELRANGEPFLRDFREVTAENVGVFVRSANEMALASGVQPGFVPMVTYLAIAEGDLVGIAKLRLQLNEALREEGGHVGFFVRAGFRGRGLATRVLALTIRQARLHQLDRVLVTCDAVNRGSLRVIEANGGILENEKTSLVSGNLIRRYWIEL